MQSSNDAAANKSPAYSLFTDKQGNYYVGRENGKSVTRTIKRIRPMGSCHPKSKRKIVPKKSTRKRRDKVVDNPSIESVHMIIEYENEDGEPEHIIIVDENKGKDRSKIIDVGHEGNHNNDNIYEIVKVDKGRKGVEENVDKVKKNNKSKFKKPSLISTSLTENRAPEKKTQHSSLNTAESRESEKKTHDNLDGGNGSREIEEPEKKTEGNMKQDEEIYPEISDDIPHYVVLNVTEVPPEGD